MGLIAEHDGTLDGYEAVQLPPARAQLDCRGAAMLRRRSARTSKRAVLYLHCLADSFVPEDLASWYTERGFHFYVADLRPQARLDQPAGGRRSPLGLGECFSALDAMSGYLRDAEAIDTMVVSAHAAGALIAALWCDARRDSRPADALILVGPAFGSGRRKRMFRRLRKADPVGQPDRAGRPGQADGTDAAREANSAARPSSTCEADQAGTADQSDTAGQAEQAGRPPKAATSAAGVKPATSAAGVKPAASAASAKPATSAAGVKPAASAAGVKPAASEASVKPATSEASVKPAASAASVKPAASAAGVKAAASEAGGGTAAAADAAGLAEGSRLPGLLAGAQRQLRGGLDIACPVLVMCTAADWDAPEGGRRRKGIKHLGGGPGTTRLGSHVTWLRLEEGLTGPLPPGGPESRPFFRELGRWLGAYLSGQFRDQLL